MAAASSSASSSSSSVASSASSAGSTVLSTSKSCALFGSSSQSTSIKLDKGNYLLWESVVLSFIEGNQLESHIDGSSEAPPRLISSDDSAGSLGSSRGGWRGGSSVPRGFLNRSPKPPDGNDISYLQLLVVSLSGGFVGVSETEHQNDVFNGASTDILPTSQITPTATSPTVPEQPRGVRSDDPSPPGIILSDSRGRTRDPELARVESGSSSNSGPNTTDTPLAQSTDHDSITSRAQNQHPMVTRARDGIHKPRYPYVGLLKCEQESNLSAIPLNTSQALFHMSDCAPCSTPMVTGKQFSKDEGELLSDVTPYRQAIGSLQYLTTTRPDISYAFNKLSQHMASPTDVHLQGVKRIFRHRSRRAAEIVFWPKNWVNKMRCQHTHGKGRVDGDEGRVGEKMEDTELAKPTTKVTPIVPPRTMLRRSQLKKLVGTQGRDAASDATTAQSQ
ncbi:putative copia-type protein [Senna tora]|uniref:Putative copia-type protein n=1 Tax=Senna tora TaxID=362788 RepID=A0A835CHT9_9FABA|nr:putative copia-type protein [Senna tora]